MKSALIGIGELHDEIKKMIAKGNYPSNKKLYFEIKFATPFDAKKFEKAFYKNAKKRLKGLKKP